VREESNAPPREVDVLANMIVRTGENRFLRVSQVIECKWSQDKPWVVFTSRGSLMAESACIAQTIGSRLGEAVMFCAAANSDLHQMETFKCPLRGGFAGRRAFEKESDGKQDQFYKAIQGVVNAAIAEGRSYDQRRIATNTVPDSGAIVFPVIIIDGLMFEAYYDAQAAEVKMEQTERLRVFWRGAKASTRFITPVDVVTSKGVEEFARSRAGDVRALLREAANVVGRIELAYKEQSFENLEIKSAPRGFLGLPPLLGELYALAKTRSS
jgi:hypothetical protein